MSGELFWQIVSGLLAAIALPTLWLVVAHLKSHTERDAKVDSRMATLEAGGGARQHQLDDAKGDIAGLEDAMEVRRQAHDACRDELTKSLNRQEKTLVAIHTELKLRPCQQGNHRGRSNPGHRAKPDASGSCPGEEGK